MIPPEIRPLPAPPAVPAYHSATASFTGCAYGFGDMARAGTYYLAFNNRFLRGDTEGNLCADLAASLE
jgi:hypothetical protein